MLVCTMLILYAVAPIGRIFSYKNDTCICYNVTTVCKSSKQSGCCLYIYIYIVTQYFWGWKGKKIPYITLLRNHIFGRFSYIPFFFWFNCHLVYMTYCKLAVWFMDYFAMWDVINWEKRGKSYECWLWIRCNDLI